MDFIEGLPKSQGYSAFLVVVDRLTKNAYFIPLKHHFSANTVAGLFVKEVVRLYGILESIVLEQRKDFHEPF